MAGLGILCRRRRSSRQSEPKTERACPSNEPHLQFDHRRRQDGFRLINRGVDGCGKTDQELAIHFCWGRNQTATFPLSLEVLQ
jgi:hypothetical protein